MTPKPLAKERLAWLMKYRADPGFNAPFIDELIAAEAYWREAVKKATAKPSSDIDCCFCHDDSGGHWPDCAWKLAQD